MKETPIIFTTENVKAILEDRTTQTRRVITHHSIPNSDIVGLQEYLYVPENTDDMSPPEGYYALLKCNANQDRKTYYFRCPHGQVGDRLWVREACFIGGIKSNEWVSYKADTIPKDIERYVWRPSIFMPRWVSRITLEITGVRAEKLQEITENDAIAEGVSYNTTNEYAQMRVLSRGQANEDTWLTPQESFRKLWDSINAKRGYGWETNPWVWVIEFKRGR